MTDVLLLHAGIGDRRQWAAQADALAAAGHRPIAPDLPSLEAPAELNRLLLDFLR